MNSRTAVHTALVGLNLSCAKVRHEVHCETRTTSRGSAGWHCLDYFHSSGSVEITAVLPQLVRSPVDSEATSMYTGGGRRDMPYGSWRLIDDARSKYKNGVVRDAKGPREVSRRSRGAACPIATWTTSAEPRHPSLVLRMWFQVHRG